MVLRSTFLAPNILCNRLAKSRINVQFYCGWQLLYSNKSVGDEVTIHPRKAFSLLFLYFDVLAFGTNPVKFLLHSALSCIHKRPENICVT